jgi:methenyltetrahydromethanopterin cyclohydrolase
MEATLALNARALHLADGLAADAAVLRITETRTAGARVLDCGVSATGGLNAGLGMARVCLAGLADVRLAPGDADALNCPTVHVATDQPVLACMASQYAGWQVAVGKYFAMGSGPMRAAHGKEALFDVLPGRERPAAAVGVLETRKLPTDEVVTFLAEKLALPAQDLTLLAAPASSTAGTVQVVARALETALHKLYELKFDLTRVMSGFGTAPLPPVAADEMKAIGRTNDAILYAGRVTVWVHCDDDQIAEIGPRVPSSSSPDHGAPFADIFERYNRDFYKVDPMLFSPAVITFNNLKTGRRHTFGRTEPDVLRRSFEGS